MVHRERVFSGRHLCVRPVSRKEVFKVLHSRSLPFDIDLTLSVLGKKLQREKENRFGLRNAGKSQQMTLLKSAILFRFFMSDKDKEKRSDQQQQESTTVTVTTTQAWPSSSLPSPPQMLNMSNWPFLQQDDQELFQEALIPPENFNMVCKHIYRSSFPKKKHFQFLEKLKLKSVL